MKFTSQVFDLSPNIELIGFYDGQGPLSIQQVKGFDTADGRAYAGVFMGEIITWDANGKCAELPDLEITINNSSTPTTVEMT